LFTNRRFPATMEVFPEQCMTMNYEDLSSDVSNSVMTIISFL